MHKYIDTEKDHKDKLTCWFNKSNFIFVFLLSTMFVLNNLDT